MGNVNEKNKYFYYFIVAAIAAYILGGTVIGLSSYFNTKNTADSRGTETNRSREADLLLQLGEYQQREEERDRREAERISRERERIERTQADLDALRAADRRKLPLYEEITAECNILADYFRSVSSEYSDANNHSGSE